MCVCVCVREREREEGEGEEREGGREETSGVAKLVAAGSRHSKEADV